MSGQDVRLNQFVSQKFGEVTNGNGLAATEIVNLMRCRTCGRLADNSAEPFNDVSDIGKIASAVAFVVEIDESAFVESVGAFEVKHIGTPECAVNREESQACRGNSKKRTVAVSH